MMDLNRTQQRLLASLSIGPRGAKDLLRELTISQPTLSRLTSTLGEHVVTLGRARATLYARPRIIRDVASRFPVFRIDETGNAHRIGTLQAIQDSQYWWEPVAGKSTMFKFLPWFIQDMRPDGFAGRAFAHRQHLDLRIPPRLQDWNMDDVLVALARRGEDCMGNLVVGEESLVRYLRLAREAALPIKSEEIYSEYPRMARKAMAGDPAGSSAGGEQPKFAAVIEDGHIQHVLVKFSQATNTPEGERWADLLVCEHLALEIIREAGFNAAQSRILQLENRTFLEVHRFDRSGRFGRLPMNSLGVIDDEFFGRRDNWIAMANRLESTKMVSPTDASTLRWLSVFGDLIANTDQHFGNVTLVPRELNCKVFILAPAYDVLPMYYRPKDGEPTFPEFNSQVPAISSEWVNAHRYALLFWERASADLRISERFRGICSANRIALEMIGEGPRLVS